jgi:threonine dehydrogenase-like Zn-dependent dehydrogenase
MASGMKALLFDGKRLDLATVPRTRARAGEALVRVHLAGICSTDLEIMRGYMAFSGIPGHEFVGTVVSAPVKRLIGNRVVGEINVPCGVCPACGAGLGKHCARRGVLGSLEIRERWGYSPWMAVARARRTNPITTSQNANGAITGMLRSWPSSKSRYR